MQKTNRLLATTSFITFCICISGFISYPGRTDDDTHDLKQQIDRMCGKLISNKKTVGLVVGVMKGDAYYMAGYGSTDLEKGLKPDSNTIFEIGSISKVFTAEITQQLVDRNMLHWNDLIYKYLPAEALPEKKDSTTLLNLVSHTSGYPRVPEYFFSKMTDMCNPYRDLQMQDLYIYLKSGAEKKQASLKNYSYSNLGSGLLGHILEFESGKNYEALLQTYICAPLHMQNTSLGVKDSSRFATGYDEKGIKTCHWNMPIIYGCGAIRSDMCDMMKFLKANMSGTDKISSSFIKTQQPVASIPPGKVAYGWHIDTITGMALDSKGIIWHNGGTGGFSTIILFDREHQTGVVVMANQSNASAIDNLGFSLLAKAVKTSFQ